MGHPIPWVMSGKECRKVTEKERIRLLNHIREQLQALCFEKEKNPEGTQ